MCELVVRVCNVGMCGSAADTAHRDVCRIFGAFVAFHTHPGFRVVCSAIQNIDAEVLLAGTDTMAHLLAAYPRGMSPRVLHRGTGRCIQIVM